MRLFGDPARPVGTGRPLAPPYSAGIGSSGHILSIGGYSTHTNLSGALRDAASRAAQSTATFDGGEPSTPTKMPRGAAWVDILISLQPGWPA